MSFGLTANGFVPKRLEDIKTELEAAFRTAFGAGIKTTPDTVFGKMIGILADAESVDWEQMEVIYNSAYPNSASGESLSRIGEITNVTPNPATKSTATVYLAGVNGTVIPKEYAIAVDPTGDQFRLTAAVTLSGTESPVSLLTRSGSVATATATAHGLSVGDWVFILGANQAAYNGLQQVVTVPTADTFTYAVSGSPATPATGIIVADPATAGSVIAVHTGPIQALAGTLTSIVNPVNGWDRVSNAEDAELGTNAETDAEFRERRRNALQGLGAAREAAITGALLQITNVTHAVVFVNDTDATVSSRPPHSIECMVVGGDAQDILDTIWAKKAAGIRAYGTSSGTIEDSQGASHTISYSRPASVHIYLELDIIIDDDFPADGEDTIIAKILEYGESLGIGDDVIVFPKLISAIGVVAGMTDIVVRIGTSASPTLDNNVVISETQRAEFDSSRITLALST